eukprot:scaffold54273_cov59-Phaeocystis_antarctica.AAC.2
MSNQNCITPHRTFNIVTPAGDLALGWGQGPLEKILHAQHEPIALSLPRAHLPWERCPCELSAIECRGGARVRAAPSLDAGGVEPTGDRRRDRHGDRYVLGVSDRRDRRADGGDDEEAEACEQREEE